MLVYPKLPQSIALLILLCNLAMASDVGLPASQQFSIEHSEATPDFQKHVVPLLGRLGCNSAKCHGSFQGQGDLRLSLFGFDFRSDLAALRANASSESGGRVDFEHPEQSLVLRKATGQTEHEGGKRFEIGSWEYHLLHRWIETGARGFARSELEEVSDATITPKEMADDQVDFFENSIRPLLETHCYECHAYGVQKGGLSLATREAITAGGDSGPAFAAGDPDASLIVRAITHEDRNLRMPPSGKLEQQAIEAMKSWVRMGAPWPDEYSSAPQETGQRLLRLEHEPVEVLFSSVGEGQSIRVIAYWEDGSREDVTCLTRFQSNDEAVVTVGRDGRATSEGPGDTHVIAFYDNGVAAIPVLRPYRLVSVPNTQRFDQGNGKSHPIDQRVNEKLKKLGLKPSAVCGDSEFLRRVCIDLTGTLPTPDEVKAFLADRDPEKRNRKIDELLQRTSYAAWWTNKLCDFTGCNPKSISSLLEVAREDGIEKATQWYDWIYERVADNEPYDDVVAGLMLSDLSQREDSMPWFWRRQSLKEPKDTAMSVAHAFLGIQLQCAECHKHPFDRWTQNDFQDFAKFFDAITKTKRSAELGQSQELLLLRSKEIRLEANDDPRVPVMQWMLEPGNPWFARAFVNRVWSGYFHVGIVHPPDQFTPANPPSNPDLLDWLSEGFKESGYDMKWLHRQIVTSDAYQRSWKPNATNRNDRRNFSRAIPRRIPAEVVYDAMKQVTVASDRQHEVRTNLQRRASGYLSMRMAGTHAMKVFGKPDRSINCDCERVNEPTLLQAIFMQNDPLVRMRVADSEWIIELEDAEAAGHINDSEVIEQIWLRTVGRFPSKEERSRAGRHLSAAENISGGAVDLLWAMMNTKEFLLNH